MVDPGVALIVAVVVVGFVSAVAWPKHGIRAKWLRARRNTQQVQIEDALKHLYNCEYKNITCTLESISGAIELPAERAMLLVQRLEAMGLVQTSGEGLVLTEEGRSYALRVIRVHRLWERYLADKTGVNETDWHAEAEKQEHRMSQAQANMLAEQMGNPRFDPHGDPIPTEEGDLPNRVGQPLTDMKPGTTVGIVHVEDEPEAVYAQLVAEGLHPGMQLRLISVSQERLLCEAEGREIILAPIIAANISVLPLASPMESDTSSDTLASLQPGQRGKVTSIMRGIRGMQRRRLMDLGIIPGTIITAEMRSAGGDPTAYTIRGTTIALRNKQAEQIQIYRVEESA